MRRREFITLFGGAVVAWPLAVRAQQPAMPVVGFIGGSSASERAHMLAAFRQGLNETGYIEGQNVAIEYRFAGGKYDRLPALVGDLIGHPVDVIFAGDAPSALAAKAASATIPIVFNSGGDVVEIGLVAGLSRPGENITGVNLIAGPLSAKQFELVHELVPGVDTIALMINPKNANAVSDATMVKEAARLLGVRAVVLTASTEADFGPAFATLVQERAGALLINADVFFTSQRDQLTALATRHAIPTIYSWREFCAAGGLISYGPSIAAAYHQIGLYVGKILRGAKPGELPVIQPTKFELVINLKTAKALGITVPPTLLTRADEVIE